MRWFSIYALPIAASAAAVASTAHTTATSMPSVTLDYSTIVATAGSESIGYYKYQNIRYAAVPTGDLRFAKPQWPPVETIVNNGTLAPENVDCATYEDCLYLDVWAPANSANKSLPVVVWSHGGRFIFGSKTAVTPEALFALSKDFIFVAYNYRLGMTGLATAPTITHEGGTSNALVWDSAHAFDWVKSTLATGEKFAGRTEQTFARAYLMSPGYVPGAGHQNAEAFYQNVSSSVGCSGGSLECMRSVNFTTLQTAATNMVSNYTYQFQPRVDGDIISDTYESQLYQKRFNFTGPLVITHELHEINNKLPTGVNTSSDIAPHLRLYFPSIKDNIVNEVQNLYPSTDYTSEGLRFADMDQDFELVAHNYALTEALNNQTWNAMVALGVATHGMDQNYYWYSNFTLVETNTTTTTTTTAAGAGIVTTTDIDFSVALKMQKYLVSFILTGNPNTMWPEDKLYWPLHGGNVSSPGQELVFNDTMYIQDDILANEKSLFWNKALWY
ncbi:esterase [Botrytis cinerea]